SSCPLKNFSGDTHIKTSGVKCTGMTFISPNASGSEGRCHGIADSFLKRGERRMCLIRPTEGINRRFTKIVLHYRKIMIGYNTIGIKYNKIISVGALKTIVAAETLSG